MKESERMIYAFIFLATSGLTLTNYLLVPKWRTKEWIIREICEKGLEGSFNEYVTSIDRKDLIIERDRLGEYPFIKLKFVKEHALRFLILRNYKNSESVSEVTLIKKERD